MILDTSTLLRALIPVAHAAENSSSGSSPIAVLGLNWQLFIAQLINFAIVLFVLWKWVFTPVAKKLQERTDRIEQSMKDADNTTKEKENFTAWREKEIASVHQQTSALLTQAKTDATKVRDEIMAKTKDDQQKLVDQAKQQIEDEKNQAVSDAKTQIADLVVLTTEKILKKKLDPKTDIELIQQALKNSK